MSTNIATDLLATKEYYIEIRNKKLNLLKEAHKTDRIPDIFRETLGGRTPNDPIQKATCATDPGLIIDNLHQLARLKNIKHFK